MPLSDLTLDECHAYRSTATEPPGFDEFWSRARSSGGPADFVEVSTSLKTLRVYDVRFPGHAEQPVRGWFVTPAGADGPLPCVVEFPGYNGGRGLPEDCLLYASAGYAHLFIDVRGQGSGWRSGDTEDHEPEGTGPQHPGFMTRGILDPEKHFYRRVMTDAVRAVHAARAHPLVDPTRVAVAGVSQGGGLALAVAGLVPDLAAVSADVPFLCDMRRGAERAATGPYLEIGGYLKVHRDRVETVFATLGHFDGVHFARRATAPALFSAALMDTTCPPSTVFGAYHNYAGPKRIEVYPFNGHEGGETVQHAERLRFFADLLHP
ncbi:acetylxylan esterase [Dactylosporangium matsuzakiense]|uniref:Acetylxylan esterase n=1 Tax=Dactylosporangium matsuzakiense TaxID=53360 RepID=A0A9W6NPK7_9ACTN|nr:acetylxylan esterase [Dactylosporangium matsuzakiense]UWZ41897.1 acetylxylan esterase [Dactylosporangium matsuzakiense]GLL04438.1 acetylxylan esterase [Dactylosporangium matsuzakiense]